MSIVTQSGDFLVTQNGDRFAPISSVTPPAQRENIIKLLRVRIGLDPNDGTKDFEILAGFDTALALAESYCDRKFEAKEDSETFVHFWGRDISLHRYPVIEVTDTSDNTEYFHVDKFAGLLRLDNMTAQHEIKVDYRGGYTDTPSAEWPFAWPADLLLALFLIFDNAYGALSTPSGGSGASGPIKTIRAGDLSITYGSEAQDYGESPAFGGLIPISATLILDLYTRRKA